MSIITVKAVGIGGQGIQFFGQLLSDAVFKQGLNISMGVLYEPSTSGGLTLADITIAPKDVEIIYPFIEKPDILIVLAQRGWDDYKDSVTDNSIVVADKDNVLDFKGVQRERAKLSFHMPFSHIARENFNNEKMMNIVALGFLAEMLDLGDNYVPALIKESHPSHAEESTLLEVAPENFEDSLITDSPKKFKDSNLQAFKLGYQLSLDTEYDKEKLLKV